MVDDAKKHESEDKQKREEVDVKNQADQLIYQTEKNVKEFNEKLSEEDKKKIEDGRADPAPGCVGSETR